MVTLSDYKEMSPHRIIYDLVGLSTDEKPLNTIEGILITNGSTLFCMDDSTVFMFDEVNKKWHKI